ncbi:hypothetical protein [Glaciecola sp. 1036]|uniref:hypothetical protein n=1 Tax=Alteromonadaceae TaxID=72275 RepID=UPI003D087E98
MDNPDLSQLSDEELLAEVKKQQNVALIDAVIVGFLFGVIIYSIMVQSFSLLTLIPLYVMFKFINKPKFDKKVFEEEITKRNLR